MPVTQAFSPNEQIPETYMVWLELHRDMRQPIHQQRIYPALDNSGSYTET